MTAVDFCRNSAKNLTLMTSWPLCLHWSVLYPGVLLKRLKSRASGMRVYGIAVPCRNAAWRFWADLYVGAVSRDVRQLLGVCLPEPWSELQWIGIHSANGLLAIFGTLMSMTWRLCCDSRLGSSLLFVQAWVLGGLPSDQHCSYQGTDNSIDKSTIFTVLLASGFGHWTDFSHN